MKNLGSNSYSCPRSLEILLAVFLFLGQGRPKCPSLHLDKLKAHPLMSHILCTLYWIYKIKISFWKPYVLLKLISGVSTECIADYLKRLSFLHCLFLPPLSNIRCPQARGFISGLSILTLGLYFCLCASIILFFLFLFLFFFFSVVLVPFIKGPIPSLWT